jgi:small subunit ribosomal protein S2
MAAYIYARKKLIHIIDIRETVRGLLRARKYLSQVVDGGSLVLFVGTKRQAGGTVERESLRCGMPFVSERWLGGALTNFRTVRSRLTRLEELEKLCNGDELQTYSKKMQSALKREFRKMYRNLNGLRSMNRLPECLVVIDPKKEKNAIREARKLGITTVALIDTDCDPDLVDLPIPGNDDGIRSIELVIRYLADGILRSKIASGAIVDKGDEPAAEPPAAEEAKIETAKADTAEGDAAETVSATSESESTEG